MKLFLRSAIAIAALAVAAPSIAADLSYPVAPVYSAPVADTVVEPAYSGAYDWSGFYAGVLAGHAWGTSEIDATGEFDVNGYLLGGFAGYNFQQGDLVYGLEADLSWTDQNGSSATSATDLEWVGTARARAGYAFDSIMPYVTGGFALADINASNTGGLSTDEVQLGLTAGAGVEVGVTENISVRAEYSFTDFGGDWDFDRNNGADLNNRSHAVKTGLAFSF